ncbi:hypothetical protein LWI29_033703 [Acer saccharum]|uniref:Uncharacterized protein n=1 Tax=Acer saccharum TaxID=4024 RepID=A0AA39RT40_ACESA|nr:hypothetical protein LWI29_033703 [Acer saccharum]
MKNLSYNKFIKFQLYCFKVYPTKFNIYSHFTLELLTSLFTLLPKVQLQCNLDIISLMLSALPIWLQIFLAILAIDKFLEPRDDNDKRSIRYEMIKYVSKRFCFKEKLNLGNLL